MRLVATTLVVASTLLLGGAGNDDQLAGYAVAGKPQRCVPISSSSASPGFTIAADQVLTYQETARRIWVTHPITTCTRMQPYDALIVERFGTDTCRGDRFRVINQGISIPSAVCIFGDFTPYDKLPKAKR